MNKTKEKINKKFDKRLLVCAFATILLVAKMYFLNNLFLVLAIAVMSISIILDKLEYKAIYLFFMLPNIYIMKFSNDQISLFTLLTGVYFISVIYSYIIEKKKINIRIIILMILLLLITAIHSVYNSEINFRVVISWLINIIVLYFIVNNIEDNKVYKKYVYYFAISLSIAGILGIIFMSGNDNIAMYLQNMRRTNTIIADGQLEYRFCGFDLDPNYFALQSLIAFWVIIVTIKNKRYSDYILSVILLIIGLFTISKMYIISLITSTLIYWMFCKKSPKRINIKSLIIIWIIGVALIYYMGDYVYNIFYSRFSTITDAQSLTTGRYETWLTYMEYIFNELNVFLFGKGIGCRYLENKATHSTYILMMYRFGVIGSIIFLNIIYRIFKTIRTENKKNGIFSIYSIPMYIFLITNFALDIIDYDSFSYLLILIFSTYATRTRDKLKEP